MPEGYYRDTKEEYLENLKDTLDLQENQFDRIDQDQERIIDRGYRYFKVYLISTSILAGSLSLVINHSLIDLECAHILKIILGGVGLIVNGIAIWKLWSFISPQDSAVLNYDLSDEDSMLAEETIESSREDFLEDMVSDFDDAVKTYKGIVHDDGISDRLGEVHKWVLSAFLYNTIMIMILVVI